MKHTDTGEHIQSKPCNPHKGHDHKHGENCGHKTVQHDGHLDYEHDGHLHRMHGEHVDECDGGKVTHVTAK